jgi:hypothetical protein
MKIKQKALLYFFLGISPLGLPLFILFLTSIGLCSGSAFSNGVSCSVPFSGYISNVAHAFEGSWFVLVPGLLWLIVSITIWVYAFIYLFLALLGKNDDSKLNIFNRSLLSKKNSNEPQSLLLNLLETFLLLVLILLALVAIVFLTDWLELV